MKSYSYVVSRDYGFAPNPFGKYCTLATCKPDIRKHASVDDWVIGTGSAKYGCAGKLVFAMRIDEKLNFNEYWEDERFIFKRPVMNGSLKKMYGDNIYHFDNQQNRWIQENSHHSHEDGTINIHNLERDLKSESVLISQYYWYFGINAVLIPEGVKNTFCKRGRGYKRIVEIESNNSFLQWLTTSFTPGYRGDPLLFNSFARYNGIS